MLESSILIWKSCGKFQTTFNILDFESLIKQQRFGNISHALF